MLSIDRLPLTVRRLLALPMIALAPLALSTAPLMLGTTGAQAAKFQLGVMHTFNGSGRGTAGGFAIGDGPVADTCTSSDPWGLCDLDDFEQRCDDAGGGLSTEPGGGVDCDTSGWD